MCEACPDRDRGLTLSRRRLLQFGGAVAAAGLLPEIAAAAPATAAATQLINPYTGSIPLVFPVPEGTYRAPVGDNWHVGREGAPLTWSHRNGTRRRHDGVDIFPLNTGSLPPVYAPFDGTVAAVFSPTSPNGQPVYRASTSILLPWNYSQAGIYGNFVWLRNNDGYFVLYCHLQDEVVIQGLKADEPVTSARQVGVMGETGNAAGEPQLHMEIHYPHGSSFTCSRCTPKKKGMTAINPYASLTRAARRPTAAV